MLIQITLCRCLYRVVPVSCAKEYDNTVADQTRKGDFAEIASRQARRSKCTKRL